MVSVDVASCHAMAPAAPTTTSTTRTIGGSSRAGRGRNEFRVYIYLLQGHPPPPPASPGCGMLPTSPPPAFLDRFPTPEFAPIPAVTLLLWAISGHPVLDNPHGATRLNAPPAAPPTAPVPTVHPNPPHVGLVPSMTFWKPYWPTFATTPTTAAPPIVVPTAGNAAPAAAPQPAALMTSPQLTLHLPCTYR